MIKYRTRWGKIEAIAVERETDKMVFFEGGKREAKRTDWQNWFDTWEEAHQFLIDEAQAKVDSLRKGLQSANGDLGRIKGMKKEQAAIKKAKGKV